MRTDTTIKPTLLADYTPPNFRFDSVYLDFDLSPKATRVKSRIVVTRLSEGSLELDGEDIRLISVSIDGKALRRKDYRLTQTHLILSDLPDHFTLEIETECKPADNTALMGLYVSSGRFCTQCEAEGFRRITYYMDRPDVLSVFTVRISAKKAKYHYLLANGNMIESGDLDDERHYAVWEDPFPKPCYLFALVAGEFDTLEDSFTTQSGRSVPLTFYVDPGQASQAEYAMDALKRAMRWDEDAFGREYDLDRFMVVAVRDFNFGAMENKGLNIFNSALLLADEATATDLNFERIESVVAHEYFHNWTGNRITCRDWFQLCLKEGFTVFRDQEFSAHCRGHAVQRIKDVRALRSRQFPEDAGPLAHPVRPKEYLKIDNFYTATIYEKGAELIRMLKTLLGETDFRKGCDYYFQTLDGTAATIEQFIACFEHVSGQNLSQFMHWYEQAGTPAIKMQTKRTDDGLVMHVSQHNASTPGQSQKDPKLIPVRWSMIHDNGINSTETVSILKTDHMVLEYALPDDAQAVPSIFQDFSAPVTLETDLTTADYLQLMRFDTNAFNRWEAGQTLARQMLTIMSGAIDSGQLPATDRTLSHYIDALRDTLLDRNFDPAFKALVLTPPADMEILQSRDQSDPVAVRLAGKWLQKAIGDHLRPLLLQIYHDLTEDGAFSASAEAAGRRALRNRCLALLAARRDPQAAPLAMKQFTTSQNMTNELAGLITLTKLGGRRVEQSLTDFYEKWKANPLVIDKWFMVAASRETATPIQMIDKLTQHLAYNKKNPNRVRALLAGFAMNNPMGFHKYDGSGYSLFTRHILDMDKRNPQVAARLLGTYEIWRKLDNHRQTLIKGELQDVMASDPSKNVLEIASKTLQ